MEAAIKLEERKERDEDFVREYVNNGGNATQAVIAVGVSPASASTVGYRLKSRLTKEIDTEQKAQLSSSPRIGHSISRKWHDPLHTGECHEKKQAQ